ncbi:chemotaxis protein CheB [Phycobacter azelaicus]|uniref:chemotaxis protein CheB n=1 Tax=Phycobacter azelaicus TaxID=2668075 RepID=UPI001867453B|nr:chemotaxis protein CheB [Phycobacter azelaicus]
MNTVEPADPFSIVAIAASAGGLEATSILAQNLPSGMNCCYVIAQHMSPSHKSMLVDLLSRETSLHVEELQQRTVPKPNIIYIPPPAKDVIFNDGGLELRNPSDHPASPKPSADRLFASLADTKGENAIGVVLSGTGSDGSYGVRSIREMGGITIAQEPTTCKYDSMPLAAIRTGCVDLTLTPQQIGAHIGLILQHPRDLSALKELNSQSGRNNDLFDVLLAHSLVDFRQYKSNTINRRIQRRMIAKGIDKFDDYVDLCRRSVEEVDALYRDLLISVTRFFRDEEQYSVLERVVAERFGDYSETEPIRIWVPGCATGEEAYSLAILVVEAMGGLDEVASDAIQIFATDIDEEAMRVGRRGIYPQAATADIPSKYLPRYFETHGDMVHVTPKLRNFVMFSRHNVFQDAPFLNMDLISIRNMLIYFSTKLQERVLTRLIYSLKRDGILFLGTSETLGHMDDHFTQLSSSARIFQLRGKGRISPRATEAAFRGGRLPPATAGEAFSNLPRSVDQWDQFDRLARSVVSDGIVLNREHTVLRVYGDIAPYCNLTSRSFGLSNLSVLKKPLASDAASLALVSLKYDQRRHGPWHRLPDMDGELVQLTAYPMGGHGEAAEDMILIGFEARAEPAVEHKKDTGDTEYVGYLEEELSRTRDALQVTIEQLQTSNEELQAINEELQSSNEELQSTNEELETSNEELQSTNEELITVNEELLVNTSQLERTTAELTGLIGNMPTVMIMVDQGLLIRYASDQALALFQLTERGIGYGHLSQAFVPTGYPPFIDLCTQALVSRLPLRQRFRAGPRDYYLSIAPVFSSDENLIGLILQIQSIESDLGHLLISDKSGGFASMGSWRINMDTGELQTTPEHDALLGYTDDNRPDSLNEGLKFVDEGERERVEVNLKAASENLEPFDFYARLARVDGKVFIGHIFGEAFRDQNSGHVYLVGVTRNVSEERGRDLLLQQYNMLTADLDVGVYSQDLENDILYWSPGLFKILGYDEIPNPTDRMRMEELTREAQSELQKLTAEALESKEPFSFVHEITRPDGSRAMIESTGHVAVNEAGKATHVYGVFKILKELDASE